MHPGPGLGEGERTDVQLFCSLADQKYTLSDWARRAAMHDPSNEDVVMPDLAMLVASAGALSKCSPLLGV
tara:strand:+ start:447 stop:656 length:210 start_codon:yes stop_codon:yes gene_type:complete